MPVAVRLVLRRHVLQPLMARDKQRRLRASDGNAARSDRDMRHLPRLVVAPLLPLVAGEAEHEPDAQSPFAGADRRPAAVEIVVGGLAVAERQLAAGMREPDLDVARVQRVRAVADRRTRWEEGGAANARGIGHGCHPHAQRPEGHLGRAARVPGVPGARQRHVRGLQDAGIAHAEMLTDAMPSGGFRCRRPRSARRSAHARSRGWPRARCRWRWSRRPR